jgi:hypothetical protein
MDYSTELRYTEARFINIYNSYLKYFSMRRIEKHAHKTVSNSTFCGIYIYIYIYTYICNERTSRSMGYENINGTHLKSIKYSTVVWLCFFSLVSSGNKGIKYVLQDSNTNK